jgi:hypothetical protein
MSSATPLIILDASTYSGTGNWIDQTLGGKDATLDQGTAALNADSDGIVLNGSTVWRFPNVPVQDSWTVNVWVKLFSGTTSEDNSCLIQQTYLNANMCMFMVYQGAALTPGFFSSNWMWAPRFVPQQNKWINIVTTYDGTSLTTYVDGLSIAEPTIPEYPCVNPGSDFLIGAKLGGAPASFTGEIGYISMYGTALSSSEILYLYNSSSYNKALVLSLQASQYSGTGSWLDQSGRGNHAALETGTVAKNSTNDGIVLDGSTSWIIPNVGVTNKWSVNVWFKKTANPYVPNGSACIFTQKYIGQNKISLFIRFVDSLNVSIGFYNAGVGDGTSFQLPMNLWTNIQGTWNGSNLKTYVNGVLLGTTQPGVASADGLAEYLIGRRWDTVVDYVIGEIGAISVHKYPLTQAQVAKIYTDSLFLVTPRVSLQAWQYTGSGPWIDETGNGRDATLETGTASKNLSGNAIVLDGSTSWTFPNVQVGNSWSLNVWYRGATFNPLLNSLILTQIYTGGPINMWLFFWNYPKILGGGFFDPNTSYILGTAIPTDPYSWANIHVSWNGTNLKTYVNGQLIGTTSPPYVSSDSGNAYRIGSSWGGSSDFATGEIGEVTIYNTPLTQAQISTLFNSRLYTFQVYQSTASVSSSSIYIGANANITVSVLTPELLPAVGEIVTLTGSNSTTSTATDNGNGTYSFSPTSSSAGTVEYTASVRGFTSRVSVTYMIRTPAYIFMSDSAGGSMPISPSTNTITVNISDIDEVALSGKTVTLTGSDSTTWTATDNLDGSYTFNVSSTTIRSVTYTATCGTISTTLIVSWTIGPSYSIALTVSPSTQITGSSSTVVATIKDYGNNPLPAQTVRLVGSDSSLPPPVNNEDGTYTFTIQSSVTGLVTYTCSDGSAQNQEISHTWIAPYPASLSIANVTESQIGLTYTFTLVILDTASNGLAGAVIDVSGSNSTYYTSTDIGNGFYSVEVISNSYTLVGYNFAVAGYPLSVSTSIEFIEPLPTGAFYLTFINQQSSVSSYTDYAGVGSSSTIIVRVLDINNNPLTQELFSLTGSDSSSYTATNNEDGTYTFVVTSTLAQSVTYTAVDNSISISMNVVFYPVCTAISWTPLLLDNRCSLWLDASGVSNFNLAAGARIGQWLDKGVSSVQIVNSESGPVFMNNSAEFQGSQSLTLSSQAVLVGSVSLVLRFINVQNQLVFQTSTFSLSLVGSNLTLVAGAQTITGPSIEAQKTYIISINNFGLYVNGLLINTGTALPIGTMSAVFGTGLYANVNEVVVYETSLIDTHRELVEGYLGWKWSIRNILPSGNPYITQKPIAQAVTTAGVRVLSFDGTGVLTPTGGLVIGDQESYTLDIWVNPEADCNILSEVAGGYIASSMWLYGGEIYAGIYNPNWVTMYPISTYIPGDWVNICITYNGSVLKKYVNGLLKSSGIITRIGTSGVTSKFIVGYTGTNPTSEGTKGLGGFLGKMSALKIYRKCLSLQEIKANFSVAAPRFGMSGIFTLPFTASTYLPLTQDTIDYGDNSQVVIVSGTPSYASVGGYDSIVLSNSSLTIKYMNSSIVTISLWFYPTDQITTSTLLRLTTAGGTSRMTIYVNNIPGKVTCDFPLWGFVLEGSFVVNSWNLVTLVMLNGAGYLLINGVNSQNSSGSGSMGAPSKLVLGPTSVNIQGLTIFNRAFTLEEVQRLYNEV